jgi:hypothetical protein
VKQHPRGSRLSDTTCGWLIEVGGALLKLGKVLHSPQSPPEPNRRCTFTPRRRPGEIQQLLNSASCVDLALLIEEVHAFLHRDDRVALMHNLQAERFLQPPHGKPQNF